MNSTVKPKTVKQLLGMMYIPEANRKYLNEILGNALYAEIKEDQVLKVPLHGFDVYISYDNIYAVNEGGSSENFLSKKCNIDRIEKWRW